MFQKIKDYIDKRKPAKVVIRYDDDDHYGYSYQRHAPDGSIGAMSMLSYAVAKEMQYICHNSDDKKGKMKAIIKDFEKGTLRLACDMSDNEYIYKPMWEEKNAED